MKFGLRFHSPQGLGVRPSSGAFGTVVLAALFVSIVLLSTSAFAVEDLTGAFDTANKLYEQGKFPDAVSAYEKLIQSGFASPAVYFNLGNAHFKSGHVGEAIAAYRRAEQLAPRDPDIRANLRFARNQVQSPTLTPARWQGWLGKFTVNEWTVLSVIALWLCLLSLAAMQLRPAWKNSLRNLAFASGFLTVGLATCLAVVWSVNVRPTVIVTAHEAAVRSGPLEEAKTVFTAHDGAELAVLDSKDDWLQVDAGQRSGWLKAAQCRQFALGRGN